MGITFHDWRAKAFQNASGWLIHDTENYFHNWEEELGSRYSHPVCLNPSIFSPAAPGHISVSLFHPLSYTVMNIMFTMQPDSDSLLSLRFPTPTLGESSTFLYWKAIRSTGPYGSYNTTFNVYFFCITHYWYGHFLNVPEIYSSILCVIGQKNHVTWSNQSLGARKVVLVV